MINLEKISGLPIELTDDFHLKFNAPLTDRKVSIARTFKEMQVVLMDKNAKNKPDQEMYYVYRDVVKPEDAEILSEHHLTYDLTIIPPGKIGSEFNKTLGHYHGDIPGKKIAHPELYEILHGKALFLLQKMDPEFKKVIAVTAFEANTGDKVIYPPNYGHILINIGQDVLVASNWLCTDYKPLYEPVADKHGLAYYVVAGEGKLYDFVANKNYPEAPPVRVINQKFMNNFPITGPKPMYLGGVTNPKNLEFLIHPDKYAVELSSITS